MAKVFTITPGLENMGAMKTGGQGSVYKGRRIGEVITAIKILPTPIYSESADDKNFAAFENEVEKLKKVNEQPNPNVVKILSSGLTETGNLPFIEMEFIKGPDLEELLKAPNDSIFTVKEVLKVAEQLSGALAHCHRLDVKHGDIKSNNVKFNTDTSNYVLLDFGLAIMSDEQRRSSLRQAGAIEFMAPEQNTGQMLFQTDVYSLGVVLFELLASSVPFPLKEKGESARNEVRLAHMVTPLPDLLALRLAALPSSWDEQKKTHEMQVPDWLVQMVYKCLEKKPELRYANGIALNEFISENYVSPNNNAENANRIALLEQENQKLLANQEQLQRQLLVYRQQLDNKQNEVDKLKTELQQKNAELMLIRDREPKAVKQTSVREGVPKRTFIGLLLFTIVLSAFLFFSFLRSRNADTGNTSAASKLPNNTVENIASNKTEPQVKTRVIAKKAAAASTIKKTPIPVQSKAAVPKNSTLPKQRQPNILPPADTDSYTPPRRVEESDRQAEENADQPVVNEKKNERKEAAAATEAAQKQMDESEPAARPEHGIAKSYLVVSKAHFYKSPDESSRRAAFIGPWENAVVDAIDEKYGFIYVIVKTPKGQIFKGWLRKRDVRLYSIE